MVVNHGPDKLVRVIHTFAIIFVTKDLVADRTPDEAATMTPSKHYTERPKSPFGR